VNYAEVRALANIEQIACWLGLDKQLQRTETQLKGDCPFCKKRASFKITFAPPKYPQGAFNCFSCDAGGDQIELVSRTNGYSRRDEKGTNEAAHLIRQQFGTVNSEHVNSSHVRKNHANTVPTAPQQGKRPAFDVNAYASKLDAGNFALEHLGLSAETLKDWKAGYAGSGVNRGRLAIALRDRDGHCIGFAGRALKDEQPALIIPNGINPHEIIFGGDRVTDGTLYLVRDVLDVLRASESGVTNCVCFLTEISALQVEMLAALMATKHCDIVELF
jgi:DNA primase